MAIDLLKLVKDAITPGAVRTAAGRLNEPTDRVEAAIGTAAPAILLGMSQVGETEDGAARLVNAAQRTNERQPGLMRDVTSFFGDGESPIAKDGAAMLEDAFGAKSSHLADAIGQSSGISSRASRSLMSTMFPLVLSVLGRHTAGMKPSEVGGLFKSQRGEWQRMLPPSLASVFGGRERVVSERVAPTEAERVATQRGTYREPERELRPAPAQRPKWVPWVLVGLVGLFAILGARALGRKNQVVVGAERPEVAAPKMPQINAPAAPAPAAPGAPAAPTDVVGVPLPNGTSVSVGRASPSYGIAKFLADPNDRAVPKTFTFNDLKYETGSANLSAASTGTVESIASILKAFPNAKIRIEGHTDDTGDSGANRELSLSRAQSMKDLLVTRGVDGSRIEAVGMGADRPLAANDTEATRAKNRRTDVIITQK